MYRLHVYAKFTSLWTHRQSCLVLNQRPWGCFLFSQLEVMKHLLGLLQCPLTPLGGWFHAACLNLISSKIYTTTSNSRCCYTRCCQSGNTCAKMLHRSSWGTWFHRWVWTSREWCMSVERCVSSVVSLSLSSPHSLCPHRHLGIHFQYHIGHYDNGCHSLPPGAPQPSHCPPGGRPANCAAPLPSAKGNCLNFMNGFKNKTDKKQNE